MTGCAAPPRLLLRLAWRGLAERPVVVALLVTAVTAGMGFQVANAANLAGYRAELVAQGITSGFGEVRLRPRKGWRITGVDAIAKEVAERERIVAAVPVLTLAGAVGRGGRFIGTAVAGLDQISARRPFHLIAGAPVRPGDTKGIVLGSSLASKLSAHVGDDVQLRLVLGTPMSLLEENDIGRHTVTVRGVAAGAFGVCGSEVALVDRGFLDAQVGDEGAADLVLVYSDAPSEAPALAARLGAAFPELEARPWTEDSSFLGGAVRSTDALAAVSRAMVVLSVLIPVWALLFVQVLHRRREVGVLCAVGFRAVDVFVIYLLEALLVGLIGTALGAVLGLALVRWFQVHPMFAMEGFVLRPALSTAVVLWPGALVIATVVIAGAIPAVRAARVDPALALRSIE